MSSISQRTPITPTEDERSALQAIDQIIATSDRLQLVGSQGETLTMPASLLDALRQVVEHLDQGDAVTIVPSHKELTTQEAANLLNISRPYMIKLLETGVLPFTKVGKHRRVRLRDVLTYQATREQHERQGLAELARLSQEVGYDT